MKTLGADLGTNSIGLTVRGQDKNGKIEEQLEYYSSVIFKTGVGNGKSGEYSFAAERTKNRSTRHLYQSRKFRIWETLKVLIEFGYCPLSITDLEKWNKYDKAKGLKRQYPINAVAFEKWVRLDFNGDGVADYSSPFQLRAELINNQFDFSDETNRFKLGRALYHIAQRRGFKSSKGETIKEQAATTHEDTDENEIDFASELKKSEEKKSKELSKFITSNNCKSVGEAFALLENKGERIRASVYEAVRSQYLEEIIEIFKFQNGLDLSSDFYKKVHKAIFFVNPLKSQKGLVGKCTLEPTKSRCPNSHPDFEEFRAWSFINTIQYRKTSQDEWTTLDIKEKEELLKEKFMRMASSFKFEEITHWLEKKKGFKLSQKEKTINYKDKTSVSGCPVSARLKDLLGEDWKMFSILSNNERINHKTGKAHPITYNYEDLWHICFSYDDSEKVQELAINKFGFDSAKAGKLVRTWGAIQQGYSMLSLKAIRNINIFLKQGLIYTDAVLLAKLPEILGADIWQLQQQNITNAIGEITEKNRKEKRLYNIVNSLIAQWKSLEFNDELNFDEKFARRDFDYLLHDSDIKTINEAIVENYGEKNWNNVPQAEQTYIDNYVRGKYQSFFSSKERDYYKLPKLGDALKKYISDSIPELHCENDFFDLVTNLPCSCSACRKLNKLYHPSIIEFYTQAKEIEIEHNGKLLFKTLLESPIIGAFKNPMAMRALHILRKQINNLLIEGIIDENTRIVVETAKDLNDANMRWAIETYQREREKENKEYEAAIIELLKDTEFKGSANPNNLDDISKFRLWIEMSKDELVSKVNSSGKPIATTELGFKIFGNTTPKFMLDILKCKTDMIKKYRLWKEQNFQCLYTGKPINIFSLFTENSTDFEHTIPRSMSFDNSMANLTVCDSFYNRQVKKNQIPTQLPNYDKTYTINGKEYTAILPRLDHWKEKVERLKDNVDFWKARSKKAQDKTQKDNAIRQKHLWKMELDYWKNKVERFTMVEVTSGFKNSQLVDTRIISKYAYHYLKSVFSKVEVQKGSVTADFRKMLGIQSVYEKKNRDKHSHHAIDAAILTLIPSAAKRDKMLELFYKKEEHEKHGWDTSKIIEELEKEKRSCKIGSIKDLPNYIEKNILINHVSKDQTLTPAKKATRVRGKIVPLKKDGKIVYETNPDGTIEYRTHKDGSLIYKRDENGEFIIENGAKVPIPKPVAMYKSGDCIRGQLNKDTFYGKIKIVKRDENHKPLRDENKNFIYNQVDGQDEIWMVERVKIQDLNIEKVIIVDPIIAEHIKKQFNEGKTADEIVDFNGKRIRHIRCRVNSAGGYLKANNVTTLKKQTYPSVKEYKNYYYTNTGDNFAFGLYETPKGKRNVISVNVLKAATIIKDIEIKTINDLFENEIQIGKETGKLIHVFKTGQFVLFFNESKEELKDLEKNELSKRLYFVKRLHQASVGNIQFQHHLECRVDDQIKKDFPKETFKSAGKDGFSTFQNDFIAPRLLFKPIKNNFIVENKDFKFNSLNEIEFLY